jgi:hypothetical protein
MNPMAMAFGIGTIAGIILFFVFLYLGWIDKFFAAIEKRFKKK